VFGLPGNYWRLWGASAISNLADGVFFIVLPLLAVRLTDSPLLVAGVAIASRLPWLFFVLIAGALADRLDRRLVMRNVQLLRVAVMGLMVVLALVDGLSLLMLYVAAIVLGMAETLFDTSAQSIMPSVVERDQLPLANGRLYGAELVMNQFVGPPLGGVLIAISVPLALGSSLVGYALAALGLTLIIGSFRAKREGPPTGMHTDIAEGLRYLINHRVLRSLALMVGVMNLAGAAIFAVFVLYAVAPGPMGLSEPEFGLLTITFAAGSVIGSFAAARMQARFGRIPLLFACVVVSAASLAVPAFTANVYLIAPAWIVSGLFVVVWNVITVSLRQRIIPDHLLGRVNSAYRLFAWGSQPIGALLGGLIGELFGLPAVFLLAGIVTMTLVAARTVITEQALVAAEAEPAPAAA
jgi:MFS family permease